MLTVPNVSPRRSPIVAGRIAQVTPSGLRSINAVTDPLDEISPIMMSRVEVAAVVVSAVIVAGVVWMPVVCLFRRALRHRRRAHRTELVEASLLDVIGRR